MTQAPFFVAPIRTLRFSPNTMAALMSVSSVVVASAPRSRGAVRASAAARAPVAKLARAPAPRRATRRA